MEPRRGMLVEAEEIAGRQRAAGTLVWILERQGDRCRIELGDARQTLPASSLVELPVPEPTAEQLRRLDPCFALPPERFTDVFDEVHDERERYRVLRCREHGALVLEDWRGGVAPYPVLVFLGPSPGDDLAALWDRYHRVPLDLLRHRGIAR